MAARRWPGGGGGGGGDMDLARGSGGFKYNARMAMALVPCVALVLGMGGKMVLGTLTVGLMVSYILDSLNIKRGSFFGVWGSLGATGVAYVITWLQSSSSSSWPGASWPLQALALLVVMQLMFLLGVWASLQFRWLQLENPSVVMALERLLFACTPFVAATCMTWGIVAALGLDHAAFYLLPIQCLVYWLFSLPRTTSFSLRSSKEASMLQGPLEACLHTLVLLFLPLLLHVAIHHRKLLSTNVLCELVILFFMPLLFQLAASARGALWWLAKDQEQLHQVRLVNGTISALALVLALEIRVVFYAFNQYIQLPPPANYLLVTAAGFAGVAATVLSLFGGVSHLLLIPLCIIAAVNSALVVGMPIKFLPAPVLAAAFLAHYIWSKSLLSYLVCIVSVSTSLTWFMVHHFWSLNIWVGGVPLQSTCKLIIANAVVAMFVPALTTQSWQKARHGTDVALVAHAILVSILENRLYNYTSMYYYGMDEDVVYPSYMVVATTAVGLLVTRRMKASNRISALGNWVLTCLFAAKLSMLVLASSKSILWVSSLLLLAISPPILLYNNGKGTNRMKPWQGVGHAAVIFSVVWACKETISGAIQSWSGGNPSDSLVLGALLLISGLASAPIVVYHFNHVQLAKRVLVLVLVTAMLCILLQPPLPISLSSVRSAAQYWPDDDVVYGTDSSPGWSTWLLLLTAVTSLAALTSVLPVRHSVKFRLAYAVGLGVCIGVYLCVEHFPGGGFLIRALLVGATTCASMILLFVLLPSELSPRLVPWQFALLVALLPVMYMLEGLQLGGNAAVTGSEEDEEGGKLLLSVLALRGAHTMLLGVYAATFMLIALVIKLQLTSILKEKQLEGSFVPKHRLLQQQHHLGIKKLVAEGTWMPVVGNVATLLCFLLCMILNYHVTGGSHRAILFVAPVLLLLNQDSNLLAGFGDRQRYFPLSAAVSLYLTLAAAYELGADSLGAAGGSLFFAAKNTLLLLVTLPGHALFNVFMWNYVTRPSSSQLVWLVVAPLNVPALVATDVNPIRALALLAILYALVQFAISRHLRIAGMKYV